MQQQLEQEVAKEMIQQPLERLLPYLEEDNPNRTRETIRDGR